MKKAVCGAIALACMVATSAFAVDNVTSNEAPELTSVRAKLRLSSDRARSQRRPCGAPRRGTGSDSRRSASSRR